MGKEELKEYGSKFFSVHDYAVIVYAKE